MNDFNVNPAKEVGRFLLAAAAAAAAQVVVGAAMAPFNPFSVSADAAFWRLLFGSAVLIGNAMVYFIRNSRYHGLKLFGLTLLAYLGVTLVLEHVETIAYNFMFGFTAGEIVFLAVLQATTALVFVPLAMVVAGKWKTHAGSARPQETRSIEEETNTSPSLDRKSFLARLAILGVLWYFIYMFAGYFIADPITHDYYAAKHPDLASINSWLPILQFFRGIAWTLLTILGVRIMNRPLKESGLIIGILYGVFHAAGLLLPNEFMPAEMRLSHFPEIVLSLVMFCGLAVSTLAYKKKGN